MTVSGANKSVLLRGVGPGLSAFTSSKILPDPQLYLRSGTALVGYNNNWGGTTLLKSVSTRVGAYGLPATSKDAALYTSLGTRTYTQTVTGDYSGLAKAEVYDADTATSPTGRFSKFFARSAVGTGSGILISGFVVAGDAPIRLLIRAIGPSLAGVTGQLKDPLLSLYRGSTLLARNDNWGGGGTLQWAFTKVGASTLATSSKDSAVIVTLNPGVYSATVTGVSSTVGVARLELYEIR
jgi:hypothetical protein